MARRSLVQSSGIHFEKGIQVGVINTQASQVKRAELDDEFDFMKSKQG